MDNSRLIIWGFFGILLYMTWQTWMLDYGPQPVETSAPATTPVADEAPLPALSDNETAASLPGIESGPAAAVPELSSDSPSQKIRVRTDVLDVEIDTRGGALVGATMLNYPVAKDQPDTKVSLLNGDGNGYDYAVVQSRLRTADDNASGTDANTVFSASRTDYDLGNDDRLEVALSHDNGAGVRIEKRYVFERGSYAITLVQDVTNASAATWRGDSITQLRMRSHEQERSMFDVASYSFDGPLLYDGEKAEKLDRDDLLDDGALQHAGANSFYASIQHHFMKAIVPAAETSNRYVINIDRNSSVLTGSVLSPAQTVAAGASGSFSETLYIGPKLQEQLNDLHPKLRLSVDYGFLTFLSQPMFWLLSWIYSFVGNWGWAIIGVTIVIKLVFYKLTEASGRSMAKMREIQPRMKALQERYKDDRQALSQAMMDLYKREKINPAAGCLPLLIQMPFFLAFYWVLVESVEMRQAPFMLWITDLSSRDPYFILPLIMGAAMLLQQRLNPAPADPVQARVMQIMPIMFTAFFAFFPAGLVLYWVTNTILSIAQQWQVNRVVHAEAQEAKNRNKKKGKKDKSAE